MRFTLVESTGYESFSESIEYKPMNNKESFDAFVKEVEKEFVGYKDAPITYNNATDDFIREIYKDGELIGYIGISEYDEEDGYGYGKAIGLSNFIILDKGKGLGKEVLKDIVEKYKDKYDTVFCCVDANNNKAIGMYKKLGKVYDDQEPDENNEYYVELYSREN